MYFTHVGFCDEFYFSKIFKKHEGISPVLFIKNSR
ncbi:AraC family transcriptional regulator [Lacrimispora brassicae]